ncbi:symmetrical bis(5'-nucleosyl)-tetraphosphatase [Burkholderia vietnamiensis]|uniref:symmetrical bis(5'-nucleosyl)-tetraphosphatase n=1 Tax=Burkholderia vietnamiensis TaxID=60552 RepID=UPI000D783C17|nr:symmetrical bis(5'-nucleosyl)-tetraphosphatase [Burkholderia vietnamiensis]GBH27268.1 Bis(5'-nucleosyl)-tetraphosphatase, symmetrical [Burkholderia vietnamiensis]
MTPPPLAIGDIQGCHSAFQSLLDKLSPPSDTPPWIAGDLVNRGPGPLAALRAVVDLGPRATVVLGNPDLPLLAVSAGIRAERPGDTIGEILAAPDAAALPDWVRPRPFAHFDDGQPLVHAGVLPQWDVTLALELADELQRALRAPDGRETLQALYGNEPNQWNPNLKKRDRMRVAFNAFTRLRFCTPDGAMEFKATGGPDSAPPGYLPGFDAPARRTENVTVVFGHWAALGLMLRDNLVALDSGCVWGNQLSAVRLTADPAQRTVTQVQCDACRTPGGE